MAGFPATGDQIGSYRVDAEIGRGGMGIVLRATQLGLNRPVALKILDPRLAADRAFTARFSREATILASLDSPHIIQIFDHGLADGYLYLAMQYVSGGDLSQLIGRTGALPPQAALRIYGQVLDALGDAHSRGIVHRDVKPSNVLLRPGDEPFAYLCDFGIAHGTEDGLTQPGLVAGSWAFMSPERHSGEPATPQSDLYSAACVLWAMLTSRNVYSGTDVQVAMSHLSAPVPQLPGSDPLVVALNRLFWACLAKDPAERPDTAAEAAALARAALPLADGVAPLQISKPDSGIFRPAGHAPPAAPATALAATVPEPRRTLIRWLVGAAALVVGLVLIAAVMVWPGRGGPTAVATPSPTPSTLAVTCWNSVGADSIDECGPPHGKNGLTWVYPSLVDQWDDCVPKAYRATTDDFDCTIPGGLVRYRYWADSDEATKHYTGKYEASEATPLLLDGHEVGTLYRAERRVSDVYTLSALWLDGHFSFSIEAGTPEQRDALLDAIRIRAYDQLTGMAAGDTPRQGEIG